MKQDFLPKSFSLPTLLMVKYSLGYLLFILHSTICEYACVNTGKSPRALIRDQNCDEHGASFQSLPKL